MSTEERKNRPYARRMSLEDRREQLLDVAVALVHELGAQAVNIDAVAKGAGVTRPVVYRVFEDANDLLQAMLDREERAALAQLAAIVPTPGSGEPVELALKGLSGFLEAVLAEPERWSTILSPVEGMPPPIRERVERSRGAVRMQIEALTRWSLAISPQGDQPDLDIELFARGLQALLEEAGRLVLADPAAFPPERIERFAALVVPRYLGEPSARRST